MPHFSELSEAAQDAIVDAALGQPPTDLPDAVKAEIKAWAESDDYRIGLHAARQII